MQRRRGSRTWVAALMAAAVTLAPMAGARTEEDLAAGTKDVGLAGAVSVSHPRDDLDTIIGLQLLPHFGYVVTDTRGPEVLRGNLELLLEPTLMHLRDGDDSATVVGVSALVRRIFAGSGRFRPYLEAGAGVLLGDMGFRQTNCDTNFLLQGGPGLLVSLSDRTALTVAYRFQHISNNDACDFNLGINSSSFHVGVSYLVP